MNNYQLVKNTEWKEVEINGEDKEIPVDWEVKKINQVAKVIAGESPDMQNINEKDGIDFHQGNTLFSSKFIQSSFKKILKEKAKKIAPVNSILMSVRAPVGETNITQNEIAIGRGLAALVPSIDRDYLINILRLNKDNISGLGNGSTFEGMKISEFSEFQFAFSPQQSSIASILSSQESIIQDIESLISKYESRFQYLSDELLSGKLRVKEVDGEVVLYKNPEDNWKEVEINGEMKEIPNDWEVDKICNIADFKNGYAFKKEDLSEIKTTNKLLKIGNISLEKKYICETNSQIYLNNINSRFELFNNDLIIAMDDLTPNVSLFGTTTIIKNESGRLFQNQRLGSIHPKIINKKYLNLQLNNNQYIFAKIATGSTAKNLSKPMIENFEIRICSDKNQFIIDSILSEQEELINNQKELLNKEKQKFDWLLDNLLSGKYLVKENNNG